MRLNKVFSTAGVLFCLSFLLPSCGPVENSSSLDRIRYGPALDLTGSSPLFASVRTSLMKCQNCHGSWLSLSETDFKTLGLVVAGSPDSSKLYYRNSSATSGPGPRTMPNGGTPALTADEIQTMVSWINAL